MTDSSDPRVYFAAERTLLAWLRTGIAIIGLGFVVSRFGLFLRAVGHQVEGPTSGYGSAAIGVALVVLGGLAIFAAAWRHVRFCRGLPASERPVDYGSGFAVWITVAVGVAAAVLAVYLVLA